MVQKVPKEMEALVEVAIATFQLWETRTGHLDDTSGDCTVIVEAEHTTVDDAVASDTSVERAATSADVGVKKRARVLAFQALLVGKVSADEAPLVCEGLGGSLLKVFCSVSDLIWKTGLIKYLGGLISEDKVPAIEGKERKRFKGDIRRIVDANAEWSTGCQSDTSALRDSLDPFANRWPEFREAIDGAFQQFPQLLAKAEVMPPPPSGQRRSRRQRGTRA